MNWPVLSARLQSAQDVLAARQRTRQIAALLELDPSQQTKLATAVSEVARNALQYGQGGKVEYWIENDPVQAALVIRVSDQGPGIPDVQHVLDTTTGLGLVSARKLVEQFEIHSTPERGTLVCLGQTLPPAAQASQRTNPARLAEALAQPGAPGLDEMEQLQAELMQAWAERDQAQQQTAELNRELEETNRGVVAIYAELDEKAEQLRRASQARTRFFSSMSHEFRTPVNSILALSQLLLERVDGDLTTEQAKQVAFVRRSAQELSDLVTDLLDLAKAEAGQVVVRPESFDVSELFGALRGVFRPLSINPAVTLVFADSIGLPPLYTDQGKVTQILRNYISNALKFTPSGEVRVSAELAPDGQFVTLAVADTGIGIAAEDQSIIFQEFGQVENPLQKRVKGTGLGLSLSKRLAELLGGQVDFRSELGRGSTFYVRLPLNYPGAPNGGAPAKISAQSEPPEAAEHILVIDDDEIARYILRGYLSGRPCNIAEAVDGEQGLQRASEMQPHVIFLDLNMPRMSGFEVLERLKADPATRAIPVIIMTSHTLTDEEQQSLSERVVTVLSKVTASRQDSLTQINAALERALKQTSRN